MLVAQNDKQEELLKKEPRKKEMLLRTGRQKKATNSQKMKFTMSKIIHVFRTASCR